MGISKHSRTAVDSTISFEFRGVIIVLMNVFKDVIQVRYICFIKTHMRKRSADSDPQMYVHADILQVFTNFTTPFRFCRL
jgi:hypothetical protein